MLASTESVSLSHAHSHNVMFNDMPQHLLLLLLSHELSLSAPHVADSAAHIGKLALDDQSCVI